MKEFLIVAGARPNFMKVAPLIDALQKKGAKHFLVHTGQHYDASLSDIFFEELNIPAPDVHLGVGSLSRIEMTRNIQQAITPVLHERKPEAMIVVGDVTSTAAATMAGVAAGIPVVHVEAGLRSYNWRMPEEMNRMIADHHSDLLFAPDEFAAKALKEEGIPSDRIFIVGNIMIDSLLRTVDRTHTSNILQAHGLSQKGYALLTLHRGENVDDRKTLEHVWEIIGDAAKKLPIIFPMHPRTKARVESFGLAGLANVIITEPVGYVDLLCLMKHANVVLTDSGGLQEETTVLNIPCLTLRTETERPLTEQVGTNLVVGHNKDKVLSSIDIILAGGWKKGAVPELWDGHAAERIADVLTQHHFST